MNSLRVVSFTAALVAASLSHAVELLLTGPSTVSVGDEFTVTLKLVDAPPLVAVATGIHFDPNVLAFQGSTAGPMLSSLPNLIYFAGSNVSGQPGFVRPIGGVSLSLAQFSGTGDLAYINLKAIGSGISSIDLYGNNPNPPATDGPDGLVDPNNQDVAHTNTGMRVNVQAVPEPLSLTPFALGSLMIARRRKRSRA